MHFKQMFVTAVCVLFLLKLKWPKSKNFYKYLKRVTPAILNVSDYNKTTQGVEQCSMFILLILDA